MQRLLNRIGWVCSKLDKPVFFSIPYFTTVQDYMRSESAYIWLYDRANNQRRRVTLRVPSEDRDSRKTLVATCANFIHQKDAYIAMKVVKKLLAERGVHGTREFHNYCSSRYQSSLNLYRCLYRFGCSTSIYKLFD